ncbi:transposable element Tcb1 transposase [Trichonephila clavipes]|nr:transposable element Tcb1 transposase [Trichonephila clavipes]
MSFTRRPDSGRIRWTSRREDNHIVINARVQPTASSVAIQAQNGAAHEETGLQHNGTRSPLATNLFNISSDDNRIRVWRPRGERLNLAVALQ